MDRNTGEPKGIAFAQFATKEGVKKALEFHETDYGGRFLRVRVASDDPPGDKGKDGKGKGKGKDGGKGKGKGKGKFFIFKVLGFISKVRSYSIEMSYYIVKYKSVHTRLNSDHWIFQQTL